MIYAGVGKTDDEIRDAINVGIAAFNIESEAEIENIDRIAGEMGKKAIGAASREPRRRRQDPRQDHDRPQGQQVRR